MKNLVIGFILILATFTVSAKEKDGNIIGTNNAATVILTGSIADEISGESLVGVEVKIEGTDMKTYTDFDGNFAFTNVKPGEYKLIANYISYQAKTEILNASANENELKIKLQSSN